MNKKTIRIFIASFIMISVSTAVFVFFINYIINQGDNLKAQIEKLEIQQAQASSYLKLERLSIETQSERDQIQSYFLLKDNDTIILLTKVESIAQEMGLSIKSGNLNTVTDKDKKEWLEVTFSFSGAESKVDDFIKVLESLPYVLRLTDISISALSSSDWKADVKMQIQIITYDKSE